MKKIIPSLLAFPRNEWKEDLPILLQKGYQIVHFDVMDVPTVGNQAYEKRDLLFLQNYPFAVRVHLMVQDPVSKAKDFFFSNTHSITFQYEHLEVDTVFNTLSTIRHAGFRCGIAIRPDSTNYVQFLPFCDVVTVMGVQPGKGGQKMQPVSLQVLKTVMAYRTKYNYLVEFDGGVNAETIEQLLPVPDLIVSGSYLYHKIKGE